MQPSQMSRAKRKPKKRPGEIYTVASYGRAIATVIERHNARKKKGKRIPHWHPNQLRHLRALELKREAGVEVARAVLGHRSPVMTEHYAGLDLATAAKVMANIG